jgi:3-oxoacyl-[acyl-carrier-protein] synthase II
MTSTPSHRVVITGLGLVSPLGNSTERLWEALATGRSGVAAIRCLPTDHLPISCGGEAREFTGDIKDFGPLQKEQMRNIRKGLKVMCREIQMGVAAAQLALADAALALGDYDSDRTGVVFGSDYIMTQPDEFAEGIRNCLTPAHDFELGRWGEEGMPKVTPLWLLKYLPNMPASHVAIYNDLRGPNNSVTLREASANLALAEAYCTIARGNADTMIAGATGTRLHPLRIVHVTLQEEVARGNGDPAKLSRPFDLNRQGMVLGEGAGGVVVEELRSAEARGARILGEVVGFGSSAVMNREGKADISKALQNVMRQALAKAEMAPEDLGHLHAHGLSTRNTDQEEAAAIHAVFGARRRPLPVTAAKSYMGNLGAAGGLVELMASVLALDKGQLFPVLNYETPDPLCPVAAVRSLDESPGDSFMNVNVTPQGQASAVVIRRLAG